MCSLFEQYIEFVLTAKIRFYLSSFVISYIVFERLKIILCLLVKTSYYICTIVLSLCPE